MTLKKTLYLILVIVVAAGSALTGAVAGGFAVYQVANQRQSVGSSTNFSTNNTPEQSFTISSTNIETDITQSVQKVGPAVVTIVGTVPG